nr:retrotransposon protein, putative, Ty1-copia subclass [Tanacetum cinerariifolium]
MDRTISSRVLSMMSQTTLPKSFWDYALKTAARILNMVPTKKVEKTLLDYVVVGLARMQLESPSVVSCAPATAVASILVDTTGTPSSTSVDQDAPSASTTLTPKDLQEPVLHQDVEGQEPLNVKFNDPFNNTSNQEPSSEESTLRVAIESDVHTNHQPFEHLIR